MGTKNFFEKNFFGPTIFKKPLFLAILVENSINLVSLHSSIDVGMHVVAQNYHNTILLKGGEKNSKFLTPKIQKINFFGPKNGKKWPKNRKFFEIFFGRNRFRMVQNVF